MRNDRAEATTSRLIELFTEERKKQGLSHQKLADLAGVHRSTISLIESRKMTPTILVCLRIAMALEVSLDELLREAQAYNL